MKARKKSQTDSDSKLTFGEEVRENVLLEEQTARFALTREAKQRIALSVLLLLLMAAALLLRYDVLHDPLSPARYLTAVKQQGTALWELLTGGSHSEGILYSVITLVIVALTGGCLAVCGTVCQGIFRTPMASPSLLGIQSGGMLAAVLYLFFMAEPARESFYYTNEELTAYLDSLSFYELFAQQLWILIGCILGSVLVLLISTKAGRGRVSGVILILSGSLFTSFSRTAVSLGQYYFTYVDPTPDRAYALMSISMGTFANTYKPLHLLMLGLPILLCMAVLFRMAPALDLLTFGEEEARAAGMNPTKVRNTAFLLCLIPCAVLLAFCGQISFVGLIVPHFARQLAGSAHRQLLPVSALTGAIALVLVYFAALCTGFTTCINLITSVVGGILFLIFLLRYRRCRNADWA